MNVEDNTAPIVACPEDQVESFTGTCEFELIDYTGLVEASDNCSDVTIEQFPAPGTIITENQEIIMVIQDAYGNATSCNFNVILEDTTNPEIVCSANISVENDLGICGAIVTYDAPIATDNCTVADVSMIEGLASGSTFPVGITVVTYQVTDGFGNTATCSFEVEVLDTELPEITCPEDILISSDLGVCGAMVNYDLPVTTDNCDLASLTLVDGLHDGEVFPVGTTVVTYEVIDIHGNVDMCSFTVTVEDAEAPTVVTCPTNIEVTNDLDACGAVVEYMLPEATDNCEVIDVSLIAGLESGQQFPEGTTTVTYQFTDAAGNMSLCTFDVTVLDSQAPAITCVDDITVANDPGMCGAMVEFDLPEVTDNCGVASLVMIEGMESGSVFPVGETTLTFEATDLSGNVSTCSFSITVLDLENPVIVCPSDINQEDAYVEYKLPEFSDNCGASIELVEGLESGSVFPHGITVVTYLVTDEAGNTAECSFEVLINTPPVGEDDETNFYEEDEEITIDVLENDYDLDGDEITISSASADNGDVEIIDNQIIYTPITDWCGNDTITYVVCDIFNACDTAVVAVQVECFIDLIIPEGFSPNGDGVNDTFEILGLEDYPGNKIAIYNRYGHKVFESEEYQSDWDGRSSGALTLGSGYLPEGTYFFVLELGNRSIKPVKGYVYLNH